MLFFSPLLSWQYLLQTTCFFAHGVVLSVLQFTFFLYILKWVICNHYYFIK
jgi:hypothetical protein